MGLLERLRLLFEVGKLRRVGVIESELRSFAVGMNSSVDVVRDEHILFLDYDITDEREVVVSVRELQRFWFLAGAWLFRTRHGFHVIFFTDVMPYDRVRMIVNYARGVDPLFKYISQYYQHKTIRVAGKYKDRDIVFVRAIKGPRVPSVRERLLGARKMREHRLLTCVGKQV